MGRNSDHITMKAYKSAESDDVKIIQCLVEQQNRRQKICFWCQETKVSIVIMTPEIADDYFFIKNQEMEIMLLKRFSQYYFGEVSGHNSKTNESMTQISLRVVNKIKRDLEWKCVTLKSVVDPWAQLSRLIKHEHEPNKYFDAMRNVNLPPRKRRKFLK